MSRYLVECAITHKKKTKLRKDGGDDLINVHEEEKPESEEMDTLVAAIENVERKISVKKMTANDRNREAQERSEASKVQGTHMAK